MENYLVISADCHAGLPDAEYAAYLEPRYREAHAADMKQRAELRVNGTVKQLADISHLIHKVPEVVAHLSNFYHLQPGDVIYTGTPEGVGSVTPGDRLDGLIDGVGSISLQIGTPE